MDSVPLDSVEGDRQGLIALYHQCSGENWKRNKNWLTDHPIGEWQGVITNGTGRLISIRLSRNNMFGSLPREIGNWTQIVNVELDINYLTGGLPQEIGNWTQVRTVYLQRNNLTGSLPREIGNWGEIIVVFLDRNNLTGSLPQEIENWTRAFHMYFACNLLTGRFPRGMNSIGGYSSFFTCHIRNWVRREKRRFFLSLT